MQSHPYRSSSRGQDGGPQESPSGNEDLLPALLIFWAVTLVRVIAGIVRHEVFGTELTIAFLVAIFVPWLLRGAPRRIRASPGAECRVLSTQAEFRFEDPPRYRAEGPIRRRPSPSLAERR